MAAVGPAPCTHPRDSCMRARARRLRRAQVRTKLPPPPAMHVDIVRKGGNKKVKRHLMMLPGLASFKGGGGQIGSLEGLDTASPHLTVTLPGGGGGSSDPGGGRLRFVGRVCVCVCARARACVCVCARARLPSKTPLNPSTPDTRARTHTRTRTHTHTQTYTHTHTHAGRVSKATVPLPLFR